MMPVELITEDLVIKPNHVFIIPANCDLPLFDVDSAYSSLKATPLARHYHGISRVKQKYWEGKLIANIVSDHDGDGGAAQW